MSITKEDFHIAGSDASGIVFKVGSGVRRWKVGDEVAVHCNQACQECPECNGHDPMACAAQKIWGYESNYGAFAQYTKVQSQQLLPKPKHLSWADAASYGLTCAPIRAPCYSAADSPSRSDKRTRRRLRAIRLWRAPAIACRPAHMWRCLASRTCAQLRRIPACVRGRA
jgi:D-arabinose 1-dehydrogenase-like Zn-dependent alcohol dehydrogenase